MENGQQQYTGSRYTSRKRAFGPGHQTRLRIEPGLMVPTVLLARLNGYGTHWSRLVTDHRSRAGIPTGTKGFGRLLKPGLPPLVPVCITNRDKCPLPIYMAPRPLLPCFFFSRGRVGVGVCCSVFFFICTIGVWCNANAN